ADQKAAGHLVDGGRMLAVDHNLAFAIEIRQAGPGHDRDRVPQPSFRRVAMLESLGQLARQIDKSSAAKRAVEYLHASVDSQGRQMTVVAPLTETLLLGGLPGSRAFTAENDDAVQIIKLVIPSLTGSGQLQHDRSSVGGLDGGRCSGRPQRATAAFFGIDHFRTVDADANGRKSGGHGGLLSSNRVELLILIGPSQAVRNRW